ncbi:MAG TPA: hypothetical protein VJV04_03045 [Nitrospiraceae bacterium]|nr:hypothetical protein [Nitrospiraceae bacterium]
MHNMKTERAILSAGKALLMQARETARKNRRRTELFLSQRQRAGSLFKKDLLERSLRAAGIDQRLLAEQQQRDQKAVTKYLTVERKRAQAAARTVSRQQEKAVRDRKKRWEQVLGKNASLSPAVVSQYLDTASEIVLSGDGTTSIAAGQNLAQTRADVSSGGYLGGPMKGALIDIDWHFVWSAPQNGLLNVTTFLQLNGASWLAVNPDCNGGVAESSLSGTLGLTQWDSSGQPQHDAETVELIDQEIQTSWGDSLGKVQFIALDETDLVGTGRAFQFPVLAEVPILITVSAQLYVFVWNAQAALDFLSGAYRLNVPFVFVSVNSGVS